MKKSFNWVATISLMLIVAVLNVVIFLTIPEGRAQEGGFWFVWGFTFPLNLIVFILALFFANRKDSNLITHVAVVFYVTITAFIIYVAVALGLFMYAAVLNFKLAIIVESVLTVIYAIVIMFVVLGLGYVARNQRVTKEKVQFIKLLKADVDGLVAYAGDNAEVIKRLSDKIRFSDPMSHPSLAQTESEISALILALRMKLRDGDTVDFEKEVNKIENLLEYRNERCKILK